jgi:hypothetical protein
MSPPFFFGRPLALGRQPCVDREEAEGSVFRIDRMVLFLSLATAPYIAESIDMGLRLILEIIFGDVGCLSELFEYLVLIFLEFVFTVDCMRVSARRQASAAGFIIEDSHLTSIRSQVHQERGCM